MHRAWLALLLACALAPRPARAQAAIDVAPQVIDAGAPELDAGPPVITPPALLRDSPAPYPPDAADGGLSGEVELRLTIDVEGAVERADLVRSAGERLDAAALQAAMSLQFSPALVNGAPTPATLGYVYRFVPPPPPPPRARLEGELVIRGRNARAAGATVTARRPEANQIGASAIADSTGHFALELEPGPWVIDVTAVELERFEKRELLAKDQDVQVQYFVTPARGAYESVVIGERERVEVSRTDLRGEELREVPGTMGGDPFRAVLMLPGVAEPVSGVAYPIVRGAAPASTGWYLDGVRLPNLFHFFLLSAVVHPEFIEGIDFYPSAYPAEFGRFTGGIANAHTANGRTDRAHGEISVDLINTGAFVETPLHLRDETLSIAVAGRFSYLGVGLRAAELLNLVDPGGFADYWDYQARVEWKPSTSRGTWRLFAFGSHDEAGSTQDNQKQNALDSTFHRIDLRWRGPAGNAQVEAGAALGLDRLVGGDSVEGDTWLFAPRANASWQIGRATLRFGGDGELKTVHIFQRSNNGLGSSTSNPDFNALNEDLNGGFGGLYVEGELPAGRFVFLPGLRGELYHSGDTTLPALEPRGAVRFRVNDATTLKLGGGLYHQPPTAYVDLPTIDLFGLQEGLQTSLNGALGVERTFDSLGLETEASVYWSEKLVLRELQLDDPEQIDLENAHQCDGRDCQLDPFRARRGRSVGFEVMIRRRLTSNLFGWVAYTLSRTTTWDPDTQAEHPNVPLGTYPELFDQTHIVNAVLSYQLPRRWRLGLGFHLNSGKPYDPEVAQEYPRFTRSPPQGSTCAGSDVNGTLICWVHQAPRSDRLPVFWRIDARIEKSWLFDRYTLTAYLDVLNASLQQEVIARNYGFDYSPTVPKVEDTTIPLVVPMLGLRGDF